jgi:hypothetical protein
MKLNIVEAKKIEIEQIAVKEHKVKALMVEMEASNKINIQKKFDRVCEEKKHELAITAYTQKKIDKENKEKRL